MLLNQEAHLNTLFAHLVSFSREYDLIDKRELQPMMDLIKKLDAINVL